MHDVIYVRAPSYLKQRTQMFILGRPTVQDFQLYESYDSFVVASEYQVFNCEKAVTRLQNSLKNVWSLYYI